MFAAFVSLLAFVIATCVVITIHEYGHYLASKWCGVKVARFSVGLGPCLLKWQGASPDYTQYTLCAYPVGGFVQLLDKTEGMVIEKNDNGREYSQQATWKRCAIILAGPLFNIFIALLIYIGILLIGNTAMHPVIGTVAHDSIAQQSGLRKGDLVLSINNQTIDHWQALQQHIAFNTLRKQPSIFKVQNPNGKKSSHRIELAINQVINDKPLYANLGIYPPSPVYKPVLELIQENSPADLAGLRQFDQIMMFNNSDISTWREFIRFVQIHPNEQVMLTVKRGNKLLKIAITPALVNEDTHSFGAIGVSVYKNPEAFKLHTFKNQAPLLSAIPNAVKKLYNTASSSLMMMYRLLINDIPITKLSGPIGIAKYAGISFDIGWIEFLSFIALLNLTIGLFNLLPIPILDGGSFCYCIIEWIKGRPFSIKSKRYGELFGYSLILIMLSITIGNDLNSILSNFITTT